MKEEQISSPTPESIEKKRALEFLALSPTEKYETTMRLKKIGDVINRKNNSGERDNERFGLHKYVGRSV